MVGSRWLLLAALLGAVQAGFWLGAPRSAVNAPAFAWWALGLLGVQAVAVAVLWDRSGREVLAVVLAFGILARVGAFVRPPDLSSDLHRYVWDGRVQLAGHDPYAAAPADPARAELRDEVVWPRINRPTAVTIYPPGAQAVFLALVGAGGDSVWGVKTLMGAAEALALALLVGVLRGRRLPIGRLAIYAWSPLVVAEVYAAGHVDALVLPVVIAALSLADARRPGAAGALIGVAALLKLYPIVLLAAVPGALGRAARAAAAMVALGYAPYVLRAGPGVIGYLPDYFRVAEDFNLGFRGFLQDGLAPVTPWSRHVAIGVSMLVLLGYLTSRFREPEEDPFGAGAAVALFLLAFSPLAVQPWYALWLAALLAVAPSAAGLWLIGALPLTYVKYGTPGEVMPAWVRPLEWLPVFALMAVAAARRRPRADR